MRPEIRTFSKDSELIKKRRNDIIKRTTKVWSKDGYSKTSMRELANALNMSIGKLYHYFGSKEEILYLVIDTATSKQREIIETCSSNLSSVGALEALPELIKTLYRWHNENQDVTLFIYQEIRTLPKDARQVIFDSERRIQNLFETILQKGFDSGEFIMEDPRLMAHNIIILGHSWAFRRWYLREGWTFETYLQEQIDIILNQLVSISPLDLNEKNKSL